MGSEREHKTISIRGATPEARMLGGEGRGARLLMLLLLLLLHGTGTLAQGESR